ncbi:hypothetical protein ACFLVY_00295 [Chloroflexota bacterium]
MKFGKTAQLVLAIGIIAIAVIFLYRMNQERAAEYEGLNAQLTTAQVLMPELISEGEELESRLNQLQIELNQAKAALSRGKASFPRSIDSIRYDELLFQMAGDRDLEMMTLVTSEPAEQSVGDVTFTVTTFAMEVKGTVDDILDFVNTIAIGDDFTAATVEIVFITVPEPVTQQEKEGLVKPEEVEQAEEGEEGEEELGAPSAAIELDIYNYRGE